MAAVKYLGGAIAGAPRSAVSTRTPLCCSKSVEALAPLAS